MSTTTVEKIEEPVVITETEESEIVAGAITDGSQAIAHDGFDVETFEQAADDYARLARTVDETAGAIHTGPALLRDLFWSFHKRAPRIAPVAPLSPAHEINREIVEQILSTTEWREMRESGTVGDNGPGLQTDADCSEVKGVGLSNTCARLDQLYGSAHRFDIGNAEGGGVLVTVTIPFRLSDEPAPASGSDYEQNPRIDR